MFYLKKYYFNENIPITFTQNHIPTIYNYDLYCISKCIVVPYFVIHHFTITQETQKSKSALQHGLVSTLHSILIKIICTLHHLKIFWLHLLKMLLANQKLRSPAKIWPIMEWRRGIAVASNIFNKIALDSCYLVP